MVIIPEVVLTNPQVVTLFPPQEAEVSIIKDDLQVLWITQRGAELMALDSATALKGLAAEGGSTKLNKFLIPTYANSVAADQEVRKGGGDAPVRKTAGLPLTTTTLFGVDSTQEKMDKIPSGVLTPLGVMINTPYLPEDHKVHRNKVLLGYTSASSGDEPSTGTDPRSIDSATVYAWQKVSTKDKPPGDWLTPKDDGTVEVTAPGKHTAEERSIIMEVVAQEKKSTLSVSKNDEVNAFTLEIGVQTGSDAGLSTLFETPTEGQTQDDLREEIVKAGEDGLNASIAAFRKATPDEPLVNFLGRALEDGKNAALTFIGKHYIESTYTTNGEAAFLEAERMSLESTGPVNTTGERILAFEVGLETMAGQVVDQFQTATDQELPLRSTSSRKATVTEPQLWSIRLIFGEVTVELVQSRNEVKINLNGEITVLKTLNPGAGAKVTTNKGQNPYSLTFIPVWNGILVSDGPQASENWMSKLTYIPRNLKVDTGEEIEKHLTRQNIKPPRFGKTGELLPRFDGGAVSTDDLTDQVLIAGADAFNFKEAQLTTQEGESLEAGLEAALQTTQSAEGLNVRNDAEKVFRKAQAAAAKKGFSESKQFDEGLTAILIFLIEGGAKDLGIVLGENSPIVKDAITKQVSFGQNLKVTFVRCGGNIQFRPVYFTDEMRVHFLHPGTTRVREDLPKDKEEQPKAVNVLGEIFDEPEVPCSFLVPVLFKNGNELDVRSGDFELVGKEFPTNTYSFKARRLNPGFRKPMCFWGYMPYTIQDPDNPKCPGFRVNNREGSLNPIDVQEPRITRVDISRNLDGGSGTLTWDRFGPDGYAFRPAQQAGRIALAVTGGIDTIPGVIYTGIGMGNAAKDSADSDTVELTLYGREIKMNDAGGGLRLINVPFFDGYDHREVMQYLCDYAGVEFHDNNTKPYKLPAGDLHGERNSVVNFKTGTPVWAAIAEVQKLAATLAFFDRFGKLQYYDVGQTGQTDWKYPLERLVSLDDSPDLTPIRNAIFIAALVSGAKGVPLDLIVERGENPHDRLKEFLTRKFVTITPQTVPKFGWDKMLFYVIPGVVKPGDVNREAARIARTVARPRATGSVSIPGNAAIELLDTFNKDWVITGLTHAIDTEAKTWSTNLQLEYLIGVEFEGPAEGDEPEADVFGTDGKRIPAITFDDLEDLAIAKVKFESQKRGLTTESTIRALIDEGKLSITLKGKWGYGIGLFFPPGQSPPGF